MRFMRTSMTSRASVQLSIGDLAKAAGVSTQAIRIWEKRGLFSSDRTEGGHRVFQAAALDKAVQLAVNSRRAKKQQLPDTANPVSIELASTGMRIRRARLDKCISQQAAADQIGISRSFLAAMERGETGVSANTLARLADTFGIPMSHFAASSGQQGRVMRAAARPRTHLAGGVVWEELAEPGSHDLEPALLHVPPGQNSGGILIRPGESFIHVLAGQLTITIGELNEEIQLENGDAFIVDGGTALAWRNEGLVQTICVWVELIGSLKKSGEKQT
jgi:transcriptional regulator with XRE-family HTH domain